MDEPSIEVVIIGATTSYRREYPPESGRECMVLKYHERWYAIPLENDTWPADRTPLAERYLS